MATQKKTLYVGGLDEQVTEAILKAAFIPFGDIVDVIVPLDHNSQEKHRGFGFVEFELTGDAAAALENMNQSELFGKVLHCNLAKPTQLSRNKPVWAEPEFYEKPEGEEGADGEAKEGETKEGGETKDKEMSDAPPADENQ